MRRLVLLFLLAGCSGSSPEDFAIPFSAPELPAVIDDVEWRIGNWEPHLAAGEAGSSWGNHRAVIEVDTTGTVSARIPWRRPDLNPESKGPQSKGLVVVDAATGQAIQNAIPISIEAAFGVVAFEATSGPGEYHVYYLPWQSTGGYYPRIEYPISVGAPDPEWRASLRSRRLPEARTLAIESVNAFHSFFPMEVIATEAEVAATLEGQDWTVFPEHRDRPIRMTRHLPVHWTRSAPSDTLELQVLRDEYVTFQLGVFAAARPLEDVQVRYGGFRKSWELTCFNCEGVDLNGEPFSKRVDIEQGRVQPLWIGFHVPKGTAPGQQVGRVTVDAGEAGFRTVTILMTVNAALAEDRGENHPETMARLAWLNSTTGSEPDFVIEPFKPVSIEGSVLRILGRSVEIGDQGLPEAIESYFTPEMTGVGSTGSPILALPMEFEVTMDGEPVQWSSRTAPEITGTSGRAEWQASSTSGDLDLAVQGALEYDGMLDLRLTLRARQSAQIDDIVLPIAYAPEAARWMLGLGYKGGRRAESIDWKWAVENHQEGVWLGGINKGMQYVLRDENYVRPLNTNFYQNQPLVLPASWYNEGKGGIQIEETGGAVVARNYAGPRTMEAGDELQFRIRMLITPFKPIDTRAQFETRFVHKYVPVDTVIAWGGTVVNIHHANEINPYINYPFFNLDLQTAYIQEAHSKGVKVKLYDTIRELTYRAYELFPMRSLGDEIFNDGEGGGHSWLQEHLRDHYHSAWHAWRVDDAAILDKGTSRWTNYYIEGLAWLARQQEIDGLYLDDIAFSRSTVKRMISVLHRYRDDVVIDLHSANQFNPRDGHINSAMLYMEHFPYISRLWFGEYFDYDQGPDYWMTEVSGLPFGLMGEMLQDGGHPYRGLLYGMTTRMYGDVDPRPVWGMMDDFGIASSRMLAYWLDDAPITTTDDRIPATAYVRGDSVLVVLASWADDDGEIALQIDSARLGLAGALDWRAPAVEGLQSAAVVDPGAVRVPANQGVYLIGRRE